MSKEIILKLKQIKRQAVSDFKKISNYQELEKLNKKYLGRQGKLNEVFKIFNNLDKNTKKQVGKLANKVKQDLEFYFNQALKRITDHKANSDFVFDESAPGKKPDYGTLHPITQFIEKITQIFIAFGFEVVEDREVETAEYNFDKLNIPANHPARDMWDTFYIKNKNQNSQKQESDFVLRTHTSPVQLRAMKTRKPPVRLVVPGRVFRHEATDASHETGFYQLEGLVIDKNISVGNMIYVLSKVMKILFGKETKLRIRPSFFPFVEPGHEVDMSCLICKGLGCSVCSNTGWLEMLGAGMVHPQVLKNMKVNPNKYSGFAFGMGIDRLMMLYYGIDDIRLSYEGDLRFLKQF